jgi:D-serine/D-alanine/glycine transporter
MVYSLAKDKSAPEKLAKLNKRKVPTNALYFSSAIVLVSVILNYIMPQGVFTLVTSISTVCFIFIWGITVISHLKYRKTRPDLAKVNKFKMPLYPFSNYLILLFLAFVLVVLAIAEDTRISLMVTPLWFIMLVLIYKTRKANVSHADGANEESLVENEKKVIIDR